jgi:hypothetical protein
MDVEKVAECRALAGDIADERRASSATESAIF